MSVKFGIRVPVSAPVTTRDRIIETVCEAEALGYDAVFVQDHIHKSYEKHRSSPPGCGSVNEPSNTADPMMFEMVATLAYLAGITRTVELGVGVAPILLRDPIVLAKQLATLDELAEGRFIFGVGVSNVTDKDEFRAMGIPFRDYAARYELAGELVAAMRTIWENSTATFHSEHVNFEGLIVYPKPARRIPVWLGCRSLGGGLDRPPVKFAIEHADGWMPPYVTTSQEFATSIQEFQTTAQEVGRNISGYEWCAQRRFSIGETMEDAQQNIGWMTKEQADMWRYAGYLQGQGEAGTGTNIKMATVGTPREIKDNVNEYLDAGANHIEVAFIYPTHEALLKQMRLFADTVMPAFK